MFVKKIRDWCMYLVRTIRTLTGRYQHPKQVTPPASPRPKRSQQLTQIGTPQARTIRARTGRYQHPKQVTPPASPRPKRSQQLTQIGTPQAVCWSQSPDPRIPEFFGTSPYDRFQPDPSSNGTNIGSVHFRHENHKTGERSDLTDAQLRTIFDGLLQAHPGVTPIWITSFQTGFDVYRYQWTYTLSYRIDDNDYDDTVLCNDQGIVRLNEQEFNQFLETHPLMTPAGSPKRSQQDTLEL